MASASAAASASASASASATVLLSDVMASPWAWALGFWVTLFVGLRKVERIYEERGTASSSSSSSAAPMPIPVLVLTDLLNSFVVTVSFGLVLPFVPSPLVTVTPNANVSVSARQMYSGLLAFHCTYHFVYSVYSILVDRDRDRDRDRESESVAKDMKNLLTPLNVYRAGSICTYAIHGALAIMLIGSKGEQEQEQAAVAVAVVRAQDAVTDYFLQQSSNLSAPWQWILYVISGFFPLVALVFWNGAKYLVTFRATQLAGVSLTWNLAAEPSTNPGVLAIARESLVELGGNYAIVGETVLPPLTLLNFVVGCVFIFPRCLRAIQHGLALLQGIEPPSLLAFVHTDDDEKSKQD